MKLNRAWILLAGLGLVGAGSVDAGDDKAPPAGEIRRDLSSVVRRQFSFELPALQLSAAPRPPSNPIVLEPAELLDPVTVKANRLKRIDLSPLEVLSPKGESEYAIKTYTSPLYRSTIAPLAQIAAYYANFLSIFSGWHPGEAEAVTLYRQEQKVRRLRQMDDFIDLERLTDPKTAKELKQIRAEMHDSP